MITSLKINGYRGFEKLEAEHLRRVNLFVGKNGSGKTSLLETIELATGGRSGIFSVLARRGESYSSNSPRFVEFDVAHLFNGHVIEYGTSFDITVTDDEKAKRVSCEIVPSEEISEERTLFIDDEDVLSDSFDELPLSISIDMGLAENPDPIHLPLTKRGGATTSRIRRMQLSTSGLEKRVTVIPITSCDKDDVSGRWAEIALTDAEKDVVDALKILNHDIERIAVVNSGDIYSHGQGSKIKVKLASLGFPIPIGSLGEGVWRMFGIAMSLATSAHGVLLIDEIDTGLHYSALVDMWKMVLSTAEKLDVQVFATTHSNDCIRALASICGNDNVSMHRVEQGREKTIPYDEAEIIAADKHDMEVR